MARPKLGLRGRLFLATLLIVGVFAGTSGLWLSGQLRLILVDSVEGNLAAHARTLATILPLGADHRQMGQLAEDFSKTTDARITIIAADGIVFADSDADIATMDNHGSRPEIIQAWGPTQYGVSMRYSNTVKKQMLYVAVPWPDQRPIGVVRVSRPLNQVEAYLANLSRVLLVGGAGGMLATLIVAAAFVQLVTRDLRQLTQRARALARGDDLDGDEIAGITGSIDRLAEELQNSVDTVANERNRLQAVLAGISEAVIALDPQGQVEVTNPAARLLLGLDGRTFGMNLLDALGDPDLDKLVRQAREQQQAVRGDLLWADPRGSDIRLDLLVTATPQLGGGVVLVLHDVTELRHLESVRRDFVANVSHELRTPVAVIQSSADALVHGAAGDPVHGPRFAEAIDRHAQRLAALITDLLDLSRLEGTGTRSALTEVPLAVLFDEVCESLREHAQGKQHTLTTTVDSSLTAMADHRSLSQVLTNLVENAVKYTPDGGTIELVAMAEQDTIRIEVRDDGPGISEQHQQRIFERFYRIDPGRSRDMGGTGLGLSIVRNLVEAQNGTVQVSHNTPRGAVFTVLLERPGRHSG